MKETVQSIITCQKYRASGIILDDQCQSLIFTNMAHAV